MITVWLRCFSNVCVVVAQQEEKKNRGTESGWFDIGTVTHIKRFPTTR